MLPLLGAGFQIGTAALNRQWRRKEEKGRRQYEQTREQDRRIYDQSMWDKVNKYNHPLSQMERLKNAGLNPNLIYGSSPGSAVGNAQSIATGKQLQGQAPQYSIDNPITPFMDTKVKQAQSNNLNTAAMKNVAGANLSSSQERRIKDLLAGDIKLQGAQIDKTEQESTMLRLKNNAMSDEKTGIGARYAIETKNLLLDNEIKQAAVSASKLNKWLTDQGIKPGDPLWFRFFGVTFNHINTKTREVRKKIENEFNELMNKFKDLL